MAAPPGTREGLIEVAEWVVCLAVGLVPGPEPCAPPGDPASPSGPPILQVSPLSQLSSLRGCPCTSQPVTTTAAVLWAEAGFGEQDAPAGWVVVTPPCPRQECKRAPHISLSSTRGHREGEGSPAGAAGTTLRTC